MTSARSKKRVLFVCTRNRVRSLTAEQLYRARPDLEVRSAGISECASVPLTEQLLDWADEVFVFSKRQCAIVQQRFGDTASARRMVCLDLPDRFDYKSPKLVLKLTARLAPYLGTPAGEGPIPASESSAPPASNGASARQLLLWPGLKLSNILGSMLLGVMVLPFVAGSALLSPAAGAIP